MAKIEIRSLSDNGVFTDVNKLIELFTKAENGKPLRVKDYNLLTIIGIEKLLTYEDIDRIVSTITSLEGDTITNRDLLQSNKVLDNIQLTLVHSKTDNTKEMLDMRWDYRGIKHNSAKEALDASASKIKSYVNLFYEETQTEQLKNVADIITSVNRAFVTEYIKISESNSTIVRDLDKLNRKEDNTNKHLDYLEYYNKEQDFLIQAVIDENEKNHARITEQNIKEYSIDEERAKKGYLEIHNITGNTLKNLSKIDTAEITYNISNFENSNNYNCKNDTSIIVEMKELLGRTLFNYNKDKDIIPKSKYDDIIGNTEELRNNEPGYMQLESIEGNTMTNVATIKEDTIISHQFDDFIGNCDEPKDIDYGTIVIDKIIGNTMTNISTSKEEFQVTHSFNNIVDGVELDLVNAEDDSHMRIGIVEGKTLENLALEKPNHMILNEEIKETFEDSITIQGTVKGGELDLIIEGHTSINMSKTKEITPVTFKYDDIIGNESSLNNAAGIIEIDTIKGNTLINKVIADSLLKVDTSGIIHLEAHAMYQISFDINKDCDNYTIEIGKQIFNHPLFAGRNEFTLYMKDEDFDGTFVFKSNNNAIVSDLEIHKGGQEILILNDKIDISNVQEAIIEDTVDLGRIDIEVEGNTILNISRTKEETIVIDAEGESFDGNSGEILSTSEYIEIESIKGMTYRNLLNELVSVSDTYTFKLLQDVSPESKYTICCNTDESFTVIIDETEYTVSNGSVITTPNEIKNYTFIVSNVVEEIDGLMLLEGELNAIPDISFLGIMSSFESEMEDDMYKIEVVTSDENGEKLDSEVFLLNEPLRSVFEYSDELAFDSKSQEVIVNRAVSQIEGSVIDRNVLCSSQAGIRIDFTGDEIQYKRIGDAEGRVPGRDFNHMMPWAGMRKVAINTLTGEKTYYNEEGYTETGSAGSIFVEIPKFYYTVMAEETENYYSNLLEGITERNLINWKVSCLYGYLESGASNYHKSTGYFDYDKSERIGAVDVEYDDSKFWCEVVYFNTSSSIAYDAYWKAPDKGKFRICFSKKDRTAFTNQDTLYLISTIRTNEFEGSHINIGEWFVSNTQETGYKVHPAFIRDGQEVDYIYVAAYESAAYSVDKQSFILDDYNINIDKDYFVSIRNALPITGFGGKVMTLSNNRICANRANAHLFDFTSLSAIQLLHLIEFASFDSQNCIGEGIVDLAESLTVSQTNKTGTTSSLIDRTGDKYAIAYRGIENLWGNTWTVIDGANLYNDTMTTIYWSNDELDFSMTEGLNKINTSSPNKQGAIRRFGYDENNSFAFIPSEVIEEGDYIGEHYEQKESSGWRIYLSGGCWSSNNKAGLYSSKQDNGTGTSNLTIGSRLLYY